MGWLSDEGGADRAAERASAGQPADCLGEIEHAAVAHDGPAAGTKHHVVEIHYAQHRHVVSRSWNYLERQWTKLALDDRRAGDRPLVFVALDSHASYAQPCRSGCGIEQHYDGALPWQNNDAACGERCLKPLPVEPDGSAASGMRIRATGASRSASCSSAFSMTWSREQSSNKAAAAS